MSPETSPLNASQAVERIREISVGRQLERLEERVARLEASDEPEASYPPLDERVLMTEARVEALHESISRLGDNTRDELERRNYLQREEIQRLAHQIQQVAATRPMDGSSIQSVQQLENKVGNWLHHWKSAIQNHLETRDHQISAHIQNELTTLRNAVDERFTEFERRLPDGRSLELRFKKIADAARAFAEAAAQLPPLPTADGSPP